MRGWLLVWMTLSSLAGLAEPSWRSYQGEIRVVLPAVPTPTETFAAAELQRYLGLLGHPAQPLVPDRPAGQALRIEVGATPAGQRLIADWDRRLNRPGRESFVMAGMADQLVLVGGSDRATLYSVYAFLEAQGCRWFYPGELGEVVPQIERLQLPVGQQRQEPVFMQREIGLSPTPDLNAEQVIDWAVKNRLTRIFGLRYQQVRQQLPEEKWDVWEKRGGYQNWQWIAHNFAWMLGVDRYFDEHPEYFALYKGERLRAGSPGKPGYGGGNLCTTNPAVIQLCADFAIAWFERHPEGLIVPLWPGDGAIKWCECETCAALGGENFTRGEAGSMSRRLITFANAVARIVGEHFPDRYLLLPAYSNYVRPVPELELEPNVMVQYCFHGDYAHGLDGSPINRELKPQLATWAAQAPGRIGIWDYFLLGDHYSSSREVAAMLPVLGRATAMLRDLQELGFSHYFTQSSTKYWKHNPLAWYLTARLSWNPQLDDAALREDFCRTMYGAAGPQVLALLDAIDDQVRKAAWYPQVYADIASPSPKVFTDELLADGDRWLEQAQAQELSDLQRRRLALVVEVWQATKANVTTQAQAGLDPGQPWRVARGDTHYLINADGYELSAERLEGIIRYAKDAGIWSADFQRLVFRGQKRSIPVVTLQNDTWQVGVLPELGGRLIRFIDRRSGRNVMHEPPEDIRLDSMGSGYVHYGGYEEYIGGGFAGLGWEAPFQVVSQSDQELHLQAELEGYRLDRWFRLDPAGLHITSELTNTSGESVTTSLRTHPAYSLGAGDQALLLAREDGWEATQLSRQHDTMDAYAGAWAVIDEATNVALAHSFDPQQATCYIFHKEDRFHLELFGRKETLAPGESLRIDQQLTILGDARSELPAWQQEVRP